MVDRTPRLETPAVGWFVLLDGGLAVLATLALSRRAHGAVAARMPLLPRWALRRLLVMALAVHVAEGVGAARLARRRGLDPSAWALQTLVVGFPSLRKLRAAGDPGPGA
ncbi:MAG: TMEM254 family protein [Acidimicrobiales bacterium]